MSDLTRFRDHCRKMAAAEHKPECESLAEPRWVNWDPADEIPHGAQLWRDMGLIRLPVSACPGCLTDAERALFASMAGEVDDYLAPQVDLFGETTAEPQPATEKTSA